MVKLLFMPTRWVYCTSLPDIYEEITLCIYVYCTCICLAFIQRGKRNEAGKGWGRKRRETEREGIKEAEKVNKIIYF